MLITVFYAWQSDSPAQTNWKLIEKAAEDACARITDDTANEFEVSLDFSTKNVIGMCDIPAEILKKIRECDIFLVDLTLVGKTPGGKALPNSNVVFELGYAAGRHTFRSLVGVFNDAFGKIEGQVFDIKRRASVRYTAKAEWTEARLERAAEKLSETLEDIFLDAINGWVVPRRARRDGLLRTAYEAAHAEFTRQVAASSFYAVTTLPAVAHSISFRWPQDVTFEAVIAAVRATQTQTNFYPEAVAWNDDASVCEIRKEGVLRHVSYSDVRSTNLQGSMAGHIEPGKFLMADHLQRKLVNRIAKDITRLHELGIKGPFFVGSSLAGAKDYTLCDLESISAPRKVDSHEVNLPIVRVPSFRSLERLNENAGVFAPVLNWLARSVGWPRSYAMLPDGTWHVRILGLV